MFVFCDLRNDDENCELNFWCNEIHVKKRDINEKNRNLFEINVKSFCVTIFYEVFFLCVCVMRSNINIFKMIWINNCIHINNFNNVHKIHDNFNFYFRILCFVLTRHFYFFKIRCYVCFFFFQINFFFLSIIFVSFEMCNFFNFNEICIFVDCCEYLFHKLHELNFKKKMHEFFRSNKNCDKC